MRSQAFTQCVGAFEGGGAKAIAFAGAILEAAEAGIGFVAAVGSSAGSIAASFLSAGISPEEVVTLMEVDFSTLLRPAEPSPLADSSRVIGKIGRLVPGTKGQLLRDLGQAGRFSSAGIEDWIDETLRQRLGQHGPVLFSDLRKPLAVLATDVSAKTYKVWSTRSTPTARVAFAVRASCSIPFFFQPVLSEGSMLVDGGLIANLPLFLKRELGSEHGRLPLLCFRLVGEEAFHSPATLGEYGESLVGAVLNGVTAVQLSLAAERQVVDVDTGAIPATQFALSARDKARLIENGRVSVRSLVRDEQTRIARSLPSFEHTPRFRDGLLEKTVELISGATRDVLVLAGDLSWLDSVCIPLLAARLRGVRIRIMSTRTGDDVYVQALEGAAAIGATVVELEKATIHGTLADPHGALGKMVALERVPTLHGRFYHKPEDQNLIDFVAAHFERVWKEHGSATGSTMPVVVGLSESAVCEALRQGVPQYNDLAVGMESVRIAAVKPLAKFLHSFKLARLRDCEYVLNHSGAGIAARIAGSSWTITPPVVERLSNGDIVVIDGTHRLYSRLQAQESEARVIVVDNPRSNLPALPLESWDQLVTRPDEVSRRDMYRHYRPDEFRNLRAAYQAHFRD